MAMTNKNLTSDGDSTPVTPRQPAEPTSLPSTPPQPQSDNETPYEVDYPSYRAVVSAKFPDHQSGVHAREQILSLALDNLVVQWFNGEAYDTPEDVHDESEDATALLIHLDNKKDGEQIIRICEQAGAIKANYYPAQSVTQEAYSPDNPYFDLPYDPSA